MEVPRLGVKSELQLSAYTIAHSKARSLTHWVRPGIEPASSWMLVGFVTTEPRQEFQRSEVLKVFPHQVGNEGLKE